METLSHYSEEKRKNSFGKIVQSYDKYRPTYSMQASETLIKKYSLNQDSKILEIGCGTGQFTQQLIPLNCTIDAIDISLEMIEFVQQKYPQNQLNFIASSFEDFTALKNSYDFIIAATSFHWVSPQAQIEKTQSLLKEEGTLVILLNWHDYSLSETDVQRDVNNVYNKISQGNVPKMLNDKTEEFFAELRNSGVFTDFQDFNFDYTQRYDVDGYIGLTATHSYQNTLPGSQKSDLLNGLRDVIQCHGGYIDIPYKTRMVCLRKA